MINKMARAFKCDVCKTYFENDTYPFLKFNGNKLSTLILGIQGGGLAGSITFDLCPECKDKVAKFLHISEEDQKGLKDVE